jgi:hypothetical protein
VNELAVCKRLDAESGLVRHGDFSDSLQQARRHLTSHPLLTSRISIVKLNFAGRLLPRYLFKGRVPFISLLDSSILIVVFCVFILFEVCLTWQIQVVQTKSAVPSNHFSIDCANKAPTAQMQRLPLVISLQISDTNKIKPKTFNQTSYYGHFIILRPPRLLSLNLSRTDTSRKVLHHQSRHRYPLTPNLSPE